MPIVDNQPAVTALINNTPSVRFFLMLKFYCFIVKSSLHYKCASFTAKRVTSGGAHLRGLVPGRGCSAGTLQRRRAVGGTVYNLTVLVIEPKTSHADDSDVFNAYGNVPGMFIVSLFKIDIGEDIGTSLKHVIY